MRNDQQPEIPVLPAILFVVLLYILGVLICKVEGLPVDSTPTPETRIHAER